MFTYWKDNNIDYPAIFRNGAISIYEFRYLAE